MAVNAPKGKVGRRDRVGLGASLALAAAFAALYGRALHLRHALYDTYAFDLGLIGQVTWNNLHGRWFDTTVMPVNYLAEHFSPALALVSPLFLLWPDVAALLALQALAVAATGVGIYLAARHCAGGVGSALLLQSAYHLAPATGWVVWDEFHQISLAMPVVAFATALLWLGRPRVAALVGALALLTNEDAALWVAPFGLLVAVVGGRRGVLWGAGLALAGVAWLAAYQLAIVPAVRPAAVEAVVPHPNVSAFSRCGRSLPEVAWCLVREPGETWRRATTEGDRAALASLLGPTAGLAVLGPSFWASAARWLVVLLGNDPPNYRAHYVAVLVPAAYVAVGEVAGWLRRRTGRAAIPRALAALVLVTSGLAYVRESPLPGGQAWERARRETPARAALLDAAVALVPVDPSVGVAATSSILPHLALRSRVYFATDGRLPPPDYKVIDLRDPYPASGEELRRHVALLRVDPWQRLLLERDEVLVFRRGYAPPDHAVDGTFGDALRLIGYDVAPAGDQVRIHLYWRALAPLPRDYHYFVHLRDEQRGFSQRDGEVAGGHLPTTRWSVGQEAREEIVIPAPPLADWPRYHLSVGWYDPQTGVRLLLPDGRDNVALPLAPTGG